MSISGAVWRSLTKKGGLWGRGTPEEQSKAIESDLAGLAADVQNQEKAAVNIEYQQRNMGRTLQRALSKEYKTSEDVKKLVDELLRMLEDAQKVDALRSNEMKDKAKELRDHLRNILNRVNVERAMVDTFREGVKKFKEWNAGVLATVQAREKDFSEVRRIMDAARARHLKLAPTTPWPAEYTERLAKSEHKLGMLKAEYTNAVGLAGEADTLDKEAAKVGTIEADTKRSLELAGEGIKDLEHEALKLKTNVSWRNILLAIQLNLEHVKKNEDAILAIEAKLKEHLTKLQAVSRLEFLEARKARRA